MKIDLKKLAHMAREKGNSTTILIVHKKLEKQLELLEELTRELLSLNGKTIYKAHPDVFGIWPENLQTKTIGIDMIHEFVRKTYLKPYLGTFKVGLIVSAERMTLESQNALLKTLEEPPSNTFLILSTSRTKKLIPTIISRCQVLEFFDKEERMINQKLVKEILRSNIVRRFRVIEEILNKKNTAEQQQQIKDLLEYLLLFFRQRLLKSRKDREKILSCIQLVESTQIVLEKNVSKRLALENLMINLPLAGVD